MKRVFIPLVLLAICALVTFAACDKKADTASEAAKPVAASDDAKKAEDAPKAEEAKKADDVKKADDADNAAENNDAPVAGSDPGDTQDFISEHVSPQGLVMTSSKLPKNKLTFVQASGTVMGEYAQEYVFNGLVSVRIERLPHKATDLASIEPILLQLESGARDVTVENDDIISKRTSYPCFSMRYLTGNNEDARQNIDTYCQTEEFDYRFHTATPVDAVDDYDLKIVDWMNGILLEENSSAG